MIPSFTVFGHNLPRCLGCPKCDARDAIGIMVQGPDTPGQPHTRVYARCWCGFRAEQQGAPAAQFATELVRMLEEETTHDEAVARFEKMLRETDPTLN